MESAGVWYSLITGNSIQFSSANVINKQDSVWITIWGNKNLEHKTSLYWVIFVS